MGLRDIIDDIYAQHALIDPDFAVAQQKALLGAQHLFELVAPPRVVWVPVRAQPGPLDPRGLEPRAFGMSRHLSVACHIWGATTELAETLLLEVHNAARASLGAGARWSSEEWPQQDGDMIAELGTAIVVVFEFRLPITELQQQAVAVTQAQQTTEMDFPDGSSVSGSPST